MNDPKNSHAAQREGRELRTFPEIFADLRALTQSKGALHEISALIYRDWLVTIDVQTGGVADAPEHRWSTSKLNNNEIMLLLGLCVQSSSDHTYSQLADTDVFLTRVDGLLEELHQRILNDAIYPLNENILALTETPEAIGRFAREAIYYGADSFYLHQFLRFTRERYRDDMTWLIQNVGLSVRPICEIAKYIVDRINSQMTATGYARSEGARLSHGDLTNSLLIAKADLFKMFGKKADSFLQKFSLAPTNANKNFSDPFSINESSISPLVDLGEYVYVPNQYRLMEAIYVSPFYWMITDEFYRNTAADHRGQFLEKTTAHIFRSVFGSENVYENVTIRHSSKDITGEVDTLIIFGEFILIIQAKSKRVTLKARAGDAEALKADFEDAIQAPYRQAIKCADAIRKGATCHTKDGLTLKLPRVPRIFPVVVLSDPFPACTYLTGKMLERSDEIAPVIWDIGVLDCVTQLLPTPIELLFYLKSRSDVFGKIHSDSEYNFLGYHIRTKLAMLKDVDWMMLERDFATVVDDYMIAKDANIEAERPLGALEKLDIPIISDLLRELKNTEPRIASIVVELYEFSGTTLEKLSAAIRGLRDEIKKTGKAIKAFSIPTLTGGLTYAVTREFSKNSMQAAREIGAKHKYDSKSDRWYIILDSVESENAVDGILPLIWDWKEDVLEAERSAQVDNLFGSRREYL